MARVTTVVLASALVAAAVLRSRLLPLCLLVLLGALAGLLAATQMKESRDLVRVPVMVAVTVLALVGVEQLGAVGIVLGVGVLLIAATPGEKTRSRADALRHPVRRSPR